MHRLTIGALPLAIADLRLERLGDGPNTEEEIGRMTDAYQNLRPEVRVLADEMADILANVSQECDGENLGLMMQSLVRRYKPQVVKGLSDPASQQEAWESFLAAVKQQGDEIKMRRALGLS